MARNKIEGSFVAMITPMNQNGSVDYQGFKTLLDFQAAHHTTAEQIMVSTGEVSKMTHDERSDLMEKTMPMRPPSASFAVVPAATTTSRTW